MSPDVSGRAEAGTPDEAPDEAADDAAGSDAGARAAATTAAAAATSTAPARPAGALDSGSVTHALAAGARTVVIDYWTTDQATTWTADGEKNVQLSAHVEGGTDEDVEVLVTRFVVTADDGTTRTVAVEDRGEFALMPPFSYSSALTVPPSAATADAVTLSVQFDLLVETEPGSQRYYRQTVLDALELPLLQEDPQ
ncbi:hypothetical protein [Blastococcus sp. SYSU D00695]